MAALMVSHMVSVAYSARIDNLLGFFLWSGTFRVRVSIGLGL